MSARFGGARDISSTQPQDEAALRWLEARQATEAASVMREKKREDVLRSSMQYGFGAAMAGTGAMTWFLNRTKGGIRARNPSVVGFGLFISFFMPFMCVTNLSRGRSQGAKTAVANTFRQT